MADTNIDIEVKAKALLGDAQKSISAFLKEIEEKSDDTGKKTKMSFEEMATAATVVAGAVTGIAAGLGALGARGADVADIRSAFEELNGTIGNDSNAVLQELRTQFAGTVSDFELMKMANGALTTGLKASQEDFALLANGARVLADRTGMDATDAFNTLATAMATGKTKGAELLIGVVDNTKALEDFANKTGKAVKDLTEQDKIEATAIATKERLRISIGGASGATADFGDKVDQSKVKITNFVDGIGTWIATTPAIGGFTSAITGVSGAVTIASAAAGPLTTAFAKLGPLVGVSGLTGAFTAFTGYLTTSVLPMVSTALPLALKALGALFTMPAGLVVAGIAAGLAIWKNWDTIGPIVQNVYTSVKTWLVDKFAAVIDAVRQKVQAVTGFFADMYDKVVGHSYVPDMVSEIGAHMGRLPALMVAPAAIASQGVSQTFQSLGQSVLSQLQGAFAGLPNVIMSAFTGGGDVGKAIGGSVVGSLFTENGVLGGLFKKGGDALGKLIGGGMGKSLGSTFGSLAGPLGTLLGGMAGDLIGPLLGKIGGAFKNLFGGPNAEELAGRDLVKTFEQNIASMLSETQRLEAGNEDWKKTVIGIRDAYVAQGRTAREGELAAERLWASSRSGAAESKKVIEEINKVLTQTKSTTAAATQVGIDGFEQLTREVAELQGTVKDPTALTTFQNQLKLAIVSGTGDLGVLQAQWNLLRTDIQKPITASIVWNTTAPGTAPTETRGGNPDAHDGAEWDLLEGFPAAYATLSGSKKDEVDRFLESNPQDFVRARKVYGFETGTFGLRDFGAGTPAVLHRHEEVLTARQSEGVATMVARALAPVSQLVAVMERGSDVHGVRQVVLPIYIGGTKVEEHVIDITNRGLANGKIRVGQRNLVDRVGRT